jgi:hypothetical protein
MVGLATVAASVSNGVSEKLRRAHMHREDFERRVERFVHSDAYRPVRQDDVEAGKRRWIIKISKNPPVIEWGALIGDCLFNFRSALDHLAYDLAVAFSGAPLPPKVEEDSAFPIFWKRAPSTSELDRRVGAIHPDARDLIEQMQPYGRTDRAALKYLDSLHNFDKHRTLHLLVAQSTALGFYGDIAFDFINFNPLEDGDVLAQVPLPDDPEAHGDPTFGFGVAFPESGPGAEAPDVTTTLSWIGQHIEKRVIPPLLPFL